MQIEIRHNMNLNNDRILKYLLVGIIYFIVSCSVTNESVIFENDIDKIKEKIESYAMKGKFHGGILIAEEGKIKFSQSYGNRNDGKVNLVEDYFHIASMGKMITGVVIGQLVENEMLNYNTTIGEVLKSYKGLDSHKSITISQLLNHSSGLPDIFSFDLVQEITKTKNWSVEKYFEYYENAPNSTEFFENRALEFPPGSNVSYSNSGYLLLGLIIESITKSSYKSYVADKVLFPSGISHRPNISAYGGGYLSMEDMYKFSESIKSGALLNGIGIVEFLNENIESEKSQYFNHGFEIDNRFNTLIINHKGGTAESKAQFILFPETNYFVIIYSNNNDNGYDEFNEMRNYIRDVLS